MTILVPRNVEEICTKLVQAGYQAWVVGGAVRDAVMGRIPHDWDIATDATPEVTQRIFKHTIPTGIDHGTITVRWNHESYEVTTFRGEGAYLDGRHPSEVVFKTSVQEDLARRDFTINAIAYDPLTGRFEDPFNGLEDIQNKVLRAVGNAEQRFSEDGLRCLRAARFSATLGFTLEAETRNAIPGTRSSYRKVAMERIRDEWIKVMGARKPSVAFQLMLETGLLGDTVPELTLLAGCKQNHYHEHDVWGHTLSVVDHLPESDPILRIVGLLHDIAKPQTKCFCEEKQDYTFLGHETLGAEVSHGICNHLRFSAEERTRICHLVENHLIRYTPEWQDKAVRRWVKRVNPESVQSLLTLAKADILGKGNAKTPMDLEVINGFNSRIQKLEEAIPTPVGVKSLKINGNTLMTELGMSPGTQIGKVLNRLLEETVDNPSLNTKEVLLTRAREIIKE